jgi:hypothetical protein
MPKTIDLEMCEECGRNAVLCEDCELCEDCCACGQDGIDDEDDTQAALDAEFSVDECEECGHVRPICLECGCCEKCCVCESGEPAGDNPGNPGTLQEAQEQARAAQSDELSERILQQRGLFRRD